MKNDPLIVIHQPDFIPYLGFFHRLASADLWIVQDGVQFSKRGWVNRDKIKTSSGVKWITIPLVSAPDDANINTRRIAYTENWQRSHLNQLASAYRKAPHFEEIFSYCEKLYALKPCLLMDFTLASIDMLCELLAISIPRLFGSTLAAKGASNRLVAEQVIKAGGRRYLSGPGARAYFDPEPYEKAGVSVIWQEFDHPEYPQLHGGFVPQLTSLDLLFNCGIVESRKNLKNCVREI